MGQSPIFWIIIAIIVFFVAREILLWYWKIRTIVKNQEEQLDLMDRLIGEVSIQNSLLLKISKGMLPDEQVQEVQQDKEKSTL